MKLRHVVALAVVVLLGAFVLGSCSLLGTDIPARISAFQGDLNNARADAYKNLVENSAPYNQTNGTTSLWDSNFPSADGPWTATITSTEPYDGAAGVYVDMVPTNGSAATKHCIIFLSDEGSIFPDFFITDIQIGSGSTYTSIFI